MPPLYQRDAEKGFAPNHSSSSIEDVRSTISSSDKATAGSELSALNERPIGADASYSEVNRPVLGICFNQRSLGPRQGAF